MKRTMSGKKEILGIDISVALDGEGIQTRWIAPRSTVACGDSHLFPLLFPLPRNAGDGSWEYSPEQARLARKAGLLVRNCNGASSFGLPLFTHRARGAWVLVLAPGMSATVDGETIRAEGDRAVHIPLSRDSAGTVLGLDGWSLSFRVEPRSRVTLRRDAVMSPFFLNTLVYGATFLAGLLFIGYLSTVPEPVVQDLPTTVKRFAVQNRARKTADRVRFKDSPPPPRKTRPVLRSALATRRLHYRTKQAKAVRTVRMAAFFKRQRSFVQRRSPDDPVDLDRPGTDSSAPTSNALPPTDPVEITLPTTPVTVVPVAPPVVSKPQRPKPHIQVKATRVSFPGISYPESAKHLGIEGKVTLRLTVDLKGTVSKVEVVRKLHPVLDRTAVTAARRARFKPARDQYGDPIESSVLITITFKLEEEEE